MRYPLYILGTLGLVVLVSFTYQQLSYIYRATLIQDKVNAQLVNIGIHLSHARLGELPPLPADSQANTDGFLDMAAMEHPWLRNWQTLPRFMQHQPKVAHHRSYFDPAWLDNQPPPDLGPVWFDAYITLLEKQQMLHLELTRYLSETERSELQRVALLDGTIGLGIFVMFWLLNYGTQRGLRRETNTLRAAMLQKEEANSGTQRAMISIMDDLRHEKSRALKLASDNQKLATLVQQSAEAMLRLDANGKIEHFNNVAAELFPGLANLPPESSFSDLFGQEDSAAVNRAILLAFHDHIVTYVQLEDLPGELDGKGLELMFSHLAPDAQNAEHTVSVVARDISSQLREQKLLREIVAQAPNALIVADERGLITVVNARVEELFGYPGDELLGQPIDGLFNESARKDYLLLQRAVIESKTAAEHKTGRDLTARRKNGSEFPIEISLTPIHIGKVALMVASMVDLTFRKQQQQALEASNLLLQNRNEEMEQFIYTVSHDLKSPLFTINGFASQLMESLEDKLDDDQRHKFNRINTNVSRMGTLLDDLLNLSRVIRQELKVQEIDTCKLLQQVCNTLETVIERSKTKILVADSLPVIHANEGMLFQCLQNLIGNAINYRDPDRTPEIRISAEVNDDAILLSITDNGVGIDSRYHQKIFGIFERLDTREGTGVGLSIVKTIMERHGGTVALASTPGIGSTFTLQFPVLKISEASAA